MRIVFSGAGPMTIMAVQLLTEQGHEVIIIELDKDKMDRLSEELDCSFLHGDASKPGKVLEAIWGGNELARSL